MSNNKQNIIDFLIKQKEKYGMIINDDLRIAKEMHRKEHGKTLNHNPNQSSVDWVIGEIMKHQMTFYGTSSIPLRIIEQGKAMHKEEHKDSYHGKLNDWYVDFEQYYNETFGGNNEQQ